MSMTGVDTFDTTIQKTNIWLNDLMRELNWDDRHKAYAVLRQVLHALRDRLTLEEAVHLGAQLPMLIRGFYYESWTPAGNPGRERRKDEFLAPIREHFKNDPHVDPEHVVRAVFRVLARRVTEGEIRDVKGMLPQEIAELWPEAAEIAR
jgi:uncharacterized protein (DUF2267 family)